MVSAAGMTKPSQPGLLKRVARALGPGLITGAADDDPSGIVTYSMAGAQPHHLQSAHAPLGWRGFA